ARSPRLVCSMTMGTSMVGGFLSDLVRRACAFDRDRERQGHGRASRRAAVEKIKGLFAADSVANSIERAILRQTRAHAFEGLFRLLGDGGKFFFQLLVGDLDFFLVGDAVEDE